jgi:dTDP-4-dehydrorhamnose reductase
VVGDQERRIPQLLRETIRLTHPRPMTSQAPRKHLVVGATGMLGREMVRLLRGRGREVVEAAWPQAGDTQYLLDIVDADAVDRFLATIRPAVVFNCAAFTDVDTAETQEALATAVNGQGVGHLAAACRAAGAKLVHVSTDYVFDGHATEPYRPNSPTAPRTAYGRSKLAGERAIKTAGGDWLIVRTSWLFGPHGKNFVDTIVNLARQKSTLKVVNDQIGCPTYVPDLARCLADLAQRDGRGLFHFCNPPPCSWFDLARQAVKAAGLACTVQPCSTAEFPRPAPRPPYSVLECSETFTRLGWTPQDWTTAVSEHIKSF